MWERLLSGMRLTSPSEPLRGQFEITGHPSPNPGITGHAHKTETLAWTHISTKADSGITGKRQGRPQANSNNHFCRPDSTEEPTRQAPQHDCMHGCGGAPCVARTRPDPFTAQLTIAVKPDPSSRIRIVPLYRGISVAQSLHDVPSCQFPDNAGDAP